MLAYVLHAVLARCSGLDPAVIEDVIVGCAMPEAEQGMNVARIGLLLAGFPNSVSGMTINRFCSSGVQAVALAADRIRLGEADVMRHFADGPGIGSGLAIELRLREAIQLTEEGSPLFLQFADGAR